MRISLKGILSAILCSCLVACSSGDCQTSSASDCLQEDDLRQLPSTDDSGQFCSSAASLVYRVNVCLDGCDFTATDSITEFITRFNRQCSGAPGCQNISRFYSSISSCFVSSGGLATLLDTLVKQFNNKENVDQLCRYLSEGKYCMRSAVASCSYLSATMNKTYDLFDKFSVAQLICGSENVLITSNNSNCDDSRNMVASINQFCDVSCSISATGNVDTICRFLQGQVDCFVSRSKGCTEIERRFVLPRLNTYAIANVLLNCPAPIQLRGVSIQPTGLYPEYPDNFRCKYTAQLNDCFNFNLPDEPVRTDVVEKFLNGNFLVDYFCDLQAQGKLNWDELQNKCVNSFLRCRLPVIDLYARASTYDDLYSPSLAPFPLDPWGLNTIEANLQCPNPPPPTLCKRPASSGGASVLPLSLRPTPADTRRTTPVKRINTPKREEQGNNGVNDPLLQKKNEEGSTTTPKYRPTPTRPKPV